YGFAPGAGFDVAGGGIAHIAVGADGEGVGAGGDIRSDGGEQVGLEQVAGVAGDAGRHAVFEVGKVEPAEGAGAVAITGAGVALGGVNVGLGDAGDGRVVDRAINGGLQ